MTARLFRNAAGFCKGDPPRGNDPAWPNFWYMALLRVTSEPACPTDSAASPDGLDIAIQGEDKFPTNSTVGAQF